MSNDDKRLIEDYLPIEAISAEASREKSVRKGHISTLHLWWARRPLVACRAAVYGALVPADRWVKEVKLKNPPDDADKAEVLMNGKKLGLNRKAASDFVKQLCLYPGSPRYIAEAERHILMAHADRLTAELTDWKARQTEKPGWVDEFKWKGDKVTVEDIVAGRAPRPRVLDMFAGGGAIPLEALRLGCEAYANDLNPVAHIIQLCTLVYPQKYGKSDSTARGMTGPKNQNGETTWGGLADEVRYWGDWVLKKVKAEIGDLYPLIPDPAHKGKKTELQPDWFKQHGSDDVPPGYLMPVAYLWTRTVKCKNPACGATVPLVKQTWLCKKDGRCVALKMVAPRGKKEVRFEVIKARSEKTLGFDPAAFSKGGNATCPFCGAVADSDYVKAEGSESRLCYQLMTTVCEQDGKNKAYIDCDRATSLPFDDHSVLGRAQSLAKKLGITIPDEPLEANPRSFDVQRFGFRNWRDILTPRQLLLMTAFAGHLRQLATVMQSKCISTDHEVALSVSLSCVLGRLADYSTSFCTWQPEFIAHTFDSPGLPMIADFAEGNPLAGASGSWESAVDYVASVLDNVASLGLPANVQRGSALSMGYAPCSFDAVITDPPYYDSRSYSNLSDHFFVWHKRALSHLLPEHFANQLTPKKTEAIAAAYRHGGDRHRADRSYEDMMEASFREACRGLKPGGPMVCVYAHKTTAGWATLVNALRRTEFEIHEAWPVEMERKVRQNAQNTAALASSIFLVARKRDAASKAGNYEADVVPDLGSIVRERVETLWDMGISGADLVIACVGAGLRAFTKYPRVEFANGEEVPAERFLMEVETVVLEAILGKLSKTVGAKAGETLSCLDPATRFYVLWRYTYGGGELDAGEAIIFANGTHVELDGQHSLTAGARALLEKKKGKYKLLDFTERGDDHHLGLPAEDGTPAPAVDALHRLMWLVEHKPPKIPDFLNEAKPNVEQLRLVAQALAGPALKGGELADVSPTAEQSALGKLLANWNAVMVGKSAIADKRAGQQQLF